MTTTTTTTKQVLHAGARYYGALTLPLYDWAVLHTVVPHAWNCPLQVEQGLYDNSIRGRKKHLDVGVASGYFLQHAKWPNHQSVELTLMDLNPNSSQYAANRLQKTGHFSTIHQIVGDAREPFPIKNTNFDSIGMFHLLHCIPGNLKQKRIVLENAARVLEPDDGVVFGANVTPADCPNDDLNTLAKLVLAFSHATGALNNQLDSHADMEEILDETFEEYELQRVGCMSLWKGSKPKV